MICNLLLIASIFISVALICFKLYVKLRTKWSDSHTCLIGKTAIVTGANGGIGYFTAQDFAKRGARVILACRNESRAQEAREKIIAATGNANVVVKLVDLALFKSVRNFCKDINDNEERLDILVNNAGIWGDINDITEDGLQSTWQVNHLSPFLLTILLIKKLKKTGASRIVNVASMAAQQGTLDIEAMSTSPESKSAFSGISVYWSTKLANILFSRQLAERLSGSDVTVYSLNPGMVTTGFWENLPEKMKRPAYVFMNFFFKTPEEGAQTTIHCAVAKELEKVSGELYDECHRIILYSSCSDMNLAILMWEKSEELVGLKEHEKMD